MIESEFDRYVSFVTCEDTTQCETPIQAMLLTIVSDINKTVLDNYREYPDEFREIRPPDMLILIVTNIFTNLAHNLMPMRDLKFRIEMFDLMNEVIHKSSKNLFLALQTYYADDKTKEPV